MLNAKSLKMITHGAFYIHINLKILPLYTEPLNDTSYMSKAWYRCQVS